MSVRHALLALLSEGPKYGLQLREEFEARTGEVWPLNGGQVYTTLQRLERDGLVESDGTGEEGPQKGFRISAEGEQELARWLRTPPDLSSPPRDELVMKVLVALYVPSADVHAVIQAHRRYVVELMQQWTRIKEYDAEGDLSMSLAIDAELFRLDSVVRWLDAAEARVNRAATEGATTWADQASSRNQTRAPLPRHRREMRDTAMSMLELRRVSKSYGQGDADVHALREVSLTADEGEMVAVMGPSGSGKSTLLTIAGTLEEPTSGEVLIAGQPVGKVVSQRQGAAAAARRSATCSRTSTCCQG